MATTRKWFSLSSSLLQIFPQCQISFQYKKLPLQYFLIATCPFGGPMAILYNKLLHNQIQIKLPNNYDKSILIFNTKGELTKIISFDLKDRVILFKFTSIEQLMIVYASGEYVTIDPYTGKRYTGTYFKQGTQLNHSINERCIAAVIDHNDYLYILKQKQLGIAKSIRGTWSHLKNIKPNIQNPILCIQSIKNSKKHSYTINNTPYPIIYLSRDNMIEEYNPSTNIKRMIFEDEYLIKNNKNLLSIGKRENNLILVYKNPFKICYIQLDSNIIGTTTSAKQITSYSHIPAQPQHIIYQHNPLLQLKHPIQISKKKSKHNYMSLSQQLIFIGQSSQISLFNNGKILILFDKLNIKIIYNGFVQNDNKLQHILIEEIDGIRVIAEENYIYRQVNQVYMQMISMQEMTEQQRKIMLKQINSTKEIKMKYQTIKNSLKHKLQSILLNNNHNQQDIHTRLQLLSQQLTQKQKSFIINQLYSLYKKYINSQLVQINQLNQLKYYISSIIKQIVQNGIKCLDKLQLIKILKFATFVQNYFTNVNLKQNKDKDKQDYQKDKDEINKQNQNVDINEYNNQNKQNIQQIQKQPQTSIHLPPLSTFLPTPIHQLCSQLRIINSLKYSYLNRFLTVQQFHYLKYQIKQKFISILLRYNMHYQLDLIFGDSETKAKIFYHWAKCKIEKENRSTNINSMNSDKIQMDSVKSQKGNKSDKKIPNSPTNSISNNSVNTYNQKLNIQSSDSYIYQSIIQKHQQLRSKLPSSHQLFSQLSKYCLDRNKLTLSLKLLQHQQHPQRRILVGVLILTSKKDKSLIQKILQYTQKSKQSFIIYRVIKQLLNLKWIDKHLWLNVFHNKLKIQEHYIKYNQFIYMDQNIKNYYLMNKMFIDLAYMGIRQIIIEETKQKIKLYEQMHIGSSDYKELKVVIFNKEQTKIIIQKIIKQYQSLIPTTCLNLKKHININNNNNKHSSLSQLRKLKSQPSITQSDISSLQSIIKLSDQQLQYLGQIILQKSSQASNKQLAIQVFCKIKSQKVYKILLKHSRVKDAIDLAYQRKNMEKLKEIQEIIREVIIIGQDEQFMTAYAREKIREMEKRGGK